LLKNIKHFSNRRTCEFRVGSFNDHLRIYCSTCCVRIALRVVYVLKIWQRVSVIIV
jgi:hypothetical protein